MLVSVCTYEWFRAGMRRTRRTHTRVGTRTQTSVQLVSLTQRNNIHMSAVYSSTKLWFL